MRGRPRRSLLTAAFVVGLSGCAGTEPPGGSGSPASTAAASSPATAPPSGASIPAAGQRIEVHVAGGQVTGDTGRVAVSVGQPVTLSVTSDTADEIHVHGYDLRTPVTAGTPAELTFDATVAGVFEVELHDAGTVLLTLQVG
jgi:hypothetical protein